ncbi:glycine-rich cell wall structural protein 1-like protein [Lates japonicus]|uniref:Glycine-rich cell wall structural protein 1-like protein n=1 Tax=Lates japonicus TaxID=270547 RepID=A0AAD3ND88_LATJO|nr:glycine-rich cell wall structural protein 1-like protein [Lates japonicus]
MPRLIPLRGEDRRGVTSDTCLYKTKPPPPTHTHSKHNTHTPVAMADFLKNTLGNEGIAKIAGEKVGGLVEDAVGKALGGGKKEVEEKKGGGGGGFGVDDALSLVAGKKDDKGGFEVGDALSLVGGNKEGGDGGGVGKALGGLFG